MCLQAERVTLSTAKRRRSHAQVNKAHKNCIPEYYGSVCGLTTMITCNLHDVFIFTKWWLNKLYNPPYKIYH